MTGRVDDLGPELSALSIPNSMLAATGIPPRDDAEWRDLEATAAEQGERWYRLFADVYDSHVRADSLLTVVDAHL